METEETFREKIKLFYEKQEAEPGIAPVVELDMGIDKGLERITIEESTVVRPKSRNGIYPFYNPRRDSRIYNLPPTIHESTIEKQELEGLQWIIIGKPQRRIEKKLKKLSVEELDRFHEKWGSIPHDMIILQGKEGKSSIKDYRSPIFTISLQVPSIERLDNLDTGKRISRWQFNDKSYFGQSVFSVYFEYGQE